MNTLAWPITVIMGYRICITVKLGYKQHFGARGDLLLMATVVYNRL